MMAKFGEIEDLTGREFGFLKVLRSAPDRVTPSGQKRKFWLCECKLCGAKKEVAGADLKSGNTKSCGCYKARAGKAARNKRVCVECGKLFECPPSANIVTCSAECRKLHAKKRRAGARLSADTKAKISKAAKGRDMTGLQAIGTEAAKASPKSGRFETNVNAKDWHLVSPDGKHYRFHSLNFWLRNNCQKLFGCEPDSRGFKNTRSGICGAKRAALGRVSDGQRPCCTYKGWRVLPTGDDHQADVDK